MKYALILALLLGGCGTSPAPKPFGFDPTQTCMFHKGVRTYDVAYSHDGFRYVIRCEDGFSVAYGMPL